MLQQRRQGQDADKPLCHLLCLRLQVLLCSGWAPSLLELNHCTGEFCMWRNYALFSPELEGNGAGNKDRKLHILQEHLWAKIMKDNLCYTIHICPCMNQRNNTHLCPPHCSFLGHMAQNWGLGCRNPANGSPEPFSHRELCSQQVTLTQLKTKCHQTTGIDLSHRGTGKNNKPQQFVITWKSPQGFFPLALWGN